MILKEECLMILNQRINGSQIIPCILGQLPVFAVKHGKNLICSD